MQKIQFLPDIMHSVNVLQGYNDCLLYE